LLGKKKREEDQSNGCVVVFVYIICASLLICGLSEKVFFVRVSSSLASWWCRYDLLVFDALFLLLPFFCN
jgi:hypothetical protein